MRLPFDLQTRPASVLVEDITLVLVMSWAVCWFGMESWIIPSTVGCDHS